MFKQRKQIVWNEGSLPEDLTFEDLKKKHSSRPHNPILASAFFKGGLIEAWGRGTIKIINECKKAGLPEPIIEYSSGGISVTILKNQLNKKNLISKGLNERQLKALEYLKENINITNSEYQRINSTSRRTALRDLTELVEMGVLINSGNRGAGTFYTLL